MEDEMMITPEQERMITEWFWDSLPKSEEHPDRRVLGGGMGDKTKVGLLRVMQRIVYESDKLS